MTRYSLPASLRESRNWMVLDGRVAHFRPIVEKSNLRWAFGPSLGGDNAIPLLEGTFSAFIGQVREWILSRGEHHFG